MSTSDQNLSPSDQGQILTTAPSLDNAADIHSEPPPIGRELSRTPALSSNRMGTRGQPANHDALQEAFDSKLDKSKTFHRHIEAFINEIRDKHEEEIFLLLETELAEIQRLKEMITNEKRYCNHAFIDFEKVFEGDKFQLSLAKDEALESYKLCRFELDNLLETHEENLLDLGETAIKTFPQSTQASGGFQSEALLESPSPSTSVLFHPTPMPTVTAFGSNTTTTSSFTKQLFSSAQNLYTTLSRKFRLLADLV